MFKFIYWFFATFFLTVCLTIIGDSLYEPKAPEFYPVQTSDFTCPLDPINITGVQQWSDGFPFDYYSRNTHHPDAWEEVDINGYYGSPIYAPENGVVEDVICDDGWVIGGCSIGIRGASDPYYYYEINHLIDPMVSVEDSVTVGDQIAHLVTWQKAYDDGRICDLNLEETTRECYKVHTHFVRHTGNKIEPGDMTTIEFIAEHCGIVRPDPDNNPEYPDLPTINCARIKNPDNPNIERCFMEAPTPTNTPTSTPSPTSSPSPTPINSITPSPTPTGSVSPTQTPSPTNTPIPPTSTPIPIIVCGDGTCHDEENVEPNEDGYCYEDCCTLYVQQGGDLNKDCRITSLDWGIMWAHWTSAEDK